jgi:hypothetical protein
MGTVVEGFVLFCGKQDAANNMVAEERDELYGVVLSQLQLDSFSDNSLVSVKLSSLSMP